MKRKSKLNKNDNIQNHKINSKADILFWHKSSKSLVPECFHNPYIEYGYRKPTSLVSTFVSLFTIHNESMNVWSHLIGFVCVIITGYIITFDIFQSENYQILEIIALEAYISCAAICLLFSSVYHWFGCYSEVYHLCLLRFDLTGIGLLVTGSFFPGVYYGFYCTPVIQMIHWGLTIIVFLIGLSVPFINIKINGIAIRPYILASLVCIGIIPFIHWLYITPYIFIEKVSKDFLLMFAWYGIGFTFFISKIPEKYFSNRLEVELDTNYLYDVYY